MGVRIDIAAIERHRAIAGDVAVDATRRAAVAKLQGGAADDVHAAAIEASIVGSQHQRAFHHVDGQLRRGVGAGVQHVAAQRPRAVIVFVERVEVQQRTLLRAGTRTGQRDGVVGAATAVDRPADAGAGVERDLVIAAAEADVAGDRAAAAVVEHHGAVAGIADGGGVAAIHAGLDAAVVVDGIGRLIVRHLILEPDRRRALRADGAVVGDGVAVTHHVDGFGRTRRTGLRHLRTGFDGKPAAVAEFNRAVAHVVTTDVAAVGGRAVGNGGAAIQVDDGVVAQADGVLRSAHIDGGTVVHVDVGNGVFAAARTDLRGIRIGRSAIAGDRGRISTEHGAIGVRRFHEDERAGENGGRGDDARCDLLHE